MMNPLKEVWKFFSPFLKPYQTRLTALFILPIIWCLVETIAPYLIKIIIDHLAFQPVHGIYYQSILIYTVIFYAFLMLVLELSIRGCHYCWIKTFPHVRADVQGKVLEWIQMQSFHFIHNQLAGDLTNKYRNLSDGFEKIAKILLYGLYPTLLSFIFSLIFIAFISPFFAIIFLLWFLSMNLITFLFFKKNMAASKEQSRSQNRLFGYIGNFISNAVTMIAFPQSLSEQPEFCRLVQENSSTAEKLEFVTFKADVLRSVASWILLVNMILFLSVGWQKSWITLGDFSFIGAICFYIRRSIWMASFQLSEFIKELGVMQEALLLIVGAESSHKDIPAAIQSKPPNFLSVSIEFHDIYFGYHEDQMLFNNLNLHIPAGQKLGITGNSGAGKTSLIQLLLRFYDPIQGKITMNEQDYRALDLNDLRNFFSYVPQSISLFHRSIFDNIAFGKPDASKDEIYEAAHLCLCDEFVQSLEKGYDTIIGEGGYKISGGQRQRVALARAYIKKAPIFLLDEALSGLEPELEAILLDRLCEALPLHTIISVSHRRSALIKMERFIELKRGQIIMDDSPHKIIE
ncbi:MAG: ABC transporter ATP-binding protein [Gammaproteobacteria bacterium]|nr:ABC transporter ATP-binding protein [Gammaproteobacteria bacterium]